jgi:uncharacterized membrane protein
LEVPTVANDTRWRRAARRLSNGLWFIPALYVVGALALSFILVHWDKSDPIDLIHSIDSSSATAALSALGSGMLAFTGFVTSIMNFAYKSPLGEISGWAKIT